MTLEINVPGGTPSLPGFSVQRNENGLSIGAGDLSSTSTMFGIANDEEGLSVNAFPVPPVSPLTGWTIYTFKRNGTFWIGPGWTLNADVLLLGGGGSGGGGFQGGGGGAGGFVDVHDFTIDSAEQGNGAVVVGAGGAEVPFRHPHGHNGGASSFASLIAYGGGYGSSEFYLTPVDPPIEGEQRVYYHASDGASGGGGGPWGDKYPPEEGDPQSAGPGGEAIHGNQGMDGDEGSGTMFYGSWRTAGGGGGAGEAGNRRGQPNGGHGRPCDIAGWGPLWADPENWDLDIRTVPWYCGGGAGMERPNLWNYLSGEGGFGGGGDPGQSGQAYTGSGGGGNGRMDERGHGNAPGPMGGSGMVIIRIHSSKEYLVRATNAVVTRITEQEIHLDEPGDGWYPI